MDATNYAEATRAILGWAARGESRYVCLATVNNIMEARASREYREVLRDAALVTSDGMPLVWVLRGLGIRDASRVYGPDLTPMVLKAAAEMGAPVGFYGGSARVLQKLVRLARDRFEGLRVAYAWAPPYRTLTEEEDRAQVHAMNETGVRILFVGLGSPKQDRWMRSHQGRVRAVMLGVGAAFDFLTRAKPQAPPWMQKSGLEWLFRLGTEPRRLAGRYLTRNPRFAVLAAAQLLRSRFDEHRRTA